MLLKKKLLGGGHIMPFLTLNRVKVRNYSSRQLINNEAKIHSILNAIEILT